MYQVLIAPMGDVYQYLTREQAIDVAATASINEHVSKITVLPMGNNVVVFPKTK